MTPESGVAMKTVFKFTTGVALDIKNDYPLKYNFQILFDGIKISIGEFYENMVTSSLLPFSGKFLKHTREKSYRISNKLKIRVTIFYITELFRPILLLVGSEWQVFVKIPLFS